MTTIYSLSSGSLPSGVAIIRVCGPNCKTIAEKMLQRKIQPRQVILANIYHPKTSELLDKALVIYFTAPNSFSGEDMLEFHCHGSIAVVDAILDALASFTKTKLAEAGEFSRRAFENGKLDLTQLEGLADIINSQTEQQRKQAIAQAGGVLRTLYENWRQKIINLRAHIEASLDFSDEQDVENINIKNDISQLAEEINNHLADSKIGEQIREGYKIVLAGKVNSGKSSLLNFLAKRDVAIVAKSAGTTRDIIEINLNIAGYLVRLFDTAGIRQTNEKIEKIGIERAIEAQKNADMILWLHASDDSSKPNAPKGAKLIFSKSDLGDKATGKNEIAISVKQKNGLAEFTTWLEKQLKKQIQQIPSGEQPILTRQRHRQLLTEAVNNLVSANNSSQDEMVAEFLRQAGDCLGRLTGRIDVEELLDVIFSEFCIGK